MTCWDKYQATGWPKTNKEDTLWNRAGKRLSLTRGRGQDGRIHEVLQEIAAQVCIYVVYMAWIYCCNQYEKKDRML